MNDVHTKAWNVRYDPVRKSAVLNNTSYYIDPTSTSILGGKLVMGASFNDGRSNGIWWWNSGDSNWATYMAVSGGVTPAGTTASGGYWNNDHAVRMRNGNFYVEDYTNNTWSMHVNYTGTAIRGQMRTPIFYDMDDTGYYTDPNSLSNMVRISLGYNSGENWSIGCSNWFRSSGATGWYNATYAGGVYMEDVTWVRTYNSKSIYTGNEVAAAGNITAYYSDERLKTKTGKLDNALTKVKSLSGFTYIENDLARSLGYKNQKQQVGVSAQQVKAVLPEAVALAPVDYETLEDGTIVSKSGEDYLTVDYSRLVPLLIEAIKELTAKVEELEAR